TRAETVCSPGMTPRSVIEYCSAGESLSAPSGGAIVQSPASRLYCARTIELAESAARKRTVTDGSPAGPGAGCEAISEIVGGVLSITNRSLTRSAFNASFGGFVLSSDATILT